MREGKGGRGGQMRVQTRESGKSGWEKWWCGLRVDVLAFPVREEASIRRAARGRGEQAEQPERSRADMLMCCTRRRSSAVMCWSNTTKYAARVHSCRCARVGGCAVSVSVSVYFLFRLSLSLPCFPDSGPAPLSVSVCRVPLFVSVSVCCFLVSGFCFLCVSLLLAVSLSRVLSISVAGADVGWGADRAASSARTVTLRARRSKRARNKRHRGCWKGSLGT
eukprot:2049834-Rhodomonas_salina.1